VKTDHYALDGAAYTSIDLNGSATVCSKKQKSYGGGSFGTTYTITVTGPGGSGSCAVQITNCSFAGGASAGDNSAQLASVLAALESILQVLLAKLQ